MDDCTSAWKSSRFGVYLLVGLAMAWLAARCAMVTAGDKQGPFLSANDRSRWCTVVALVEQGKWEIDDVIQRKGWNTIDKVYHLDQNDEPHYYSSKPTLFPFLMTIPYRALRAVTGWDLSERPFLVGRLLIFAINGTFLALFFIAMVRICRRYCRTRWGLLFVSAVVAWGTFLSTFAVSINNHLPAAAAIAVALDQLLRIWLEGRDDFWRFVVIGLASAFAASCELPALGFLVMVAFGLLLAWPRKTLLGFLPPVVLVAAGFFLTNHAAHGTYVPAYAHRVEGEDWRGSNWYNYPKSYWLEGNRRGVDIGEPSKIKYGFHVLIGHHGIWSLSPVWLLSIVGIGVWGTRKGGLAFALLVLATTLSAIVFYVMLRGQRDRNYAGVCCGFRWAFWLIPMFIVAVIPVADRIANHARYRRFACLLLMISAGSAAYGWFNPWVHPWLYTMLGGV